MISYTLMCDKDHEFSEHFDGFDDLQAKLKAKVLKCPVCRFDAFDQGSFNPQRRRSRRARIVHLPGGKRLHERRLCV